MGKKLMILGAGRGQVGLIQTAKKLGYTTVVTSIAGNYPGFAYADEICHADISNPQQVSQAAMRLGVSGIATACLDTGVPALGYACEQNHLTGLSERSAKLCGDKLLMKTAFMEKGVNTARFKKVSSLEDVEHVLETLNLPLIVKAVDLQGSRGIFIARTREELFGGYEKAMRETNKDFCIIEEFIEGYEFGAQAFVVDRKVLFILPCGDETYMAGTAIPVGHYAPLQLEEDVLQQVYQQVSLAISAVELNDCAVNIDMILKDGKVYMIELTGRIGANCLPELTSIYYGVDIYKMIIATAMGENPEAYFHTTKKKPTPCYAKMLLSEKSGTIKKIINQNGDHSDIVEITFFVHEGDRINRFSNSRDCLGQVIVKGDTLEECEKLIEEVVSNIEFVLE